MRSSASVQATDSGLSPTVLVLAFVAGVVAVPIFHQGLFYLFHLAGIIPVPPFDMTPTKPLGVPSVISASFWGGVWGIVFVLTLPRLFHGGAYWVAAFVASGIALTLVYAFVVVPLQSGALPGDLVGLLIIGFLLNAAWGIGVALFLKLFDQLRGGKSAMA